MQRVLLNPRLCLNNVCFPLQINASVITDSWNDGSAALQIKLFNHPVSISFCFAVIVPLLWHHDVMSTTHPRAVLVAAGLGASRVSRSSKNETTTKKKNLLTWRFEVLVVAKLWNKEPLFAALSMERHLKLQWDLTICAVNTSMDARRWTLLSQIPSSSSNSRCFRILSCSFYLFPHKGEEAPAWLIFSLFLSFDGLVQFLDLSHCRWAQIRNLMLKPAKMQPMSLFQTSLS